jgi:catechol 2,3-dioxygenase-like lactoylglutathione lyase family enzyme
VAITELNHYFVRANDLEETKRFYCDVLGFEVMPRPDLPFVGYWLGTNGSVQIHMGPHGVAEAEVFYLGTPPNAATDQAGVVDHIAFLATEPERMSARLEQHGVHGTKRYLPEFGLCQLFVDDPNGLTIELNFFGVDHEPDW